MYTTLNKIREHSPCKCGWEKLLKHLGKTCADDEPLLLLTILDSNGLADALWCLRAIEGFDKEKRLYAIWCARQVQHLMTDERSVKALDVAERFANGLATEEELIAACDAAYAAADAAYAARAAAGAARAAARAAACAAAAYAYAAAADADARAAAARAAAAYAAAACAAWRAADVEMRARQEAEFRRVLNACMGVVK